jgi:hypothetical protein
MTETRDPLIAQALERWRIRDEAPGWQEVLARAGFAETARRHRPARRVYVAALLAVAVAVAAPAFALVARHFLSAHPVPGTTTTVRLEIGSGGSAELHLRSRGSPLGRDAAGYRFLRTNTNNTRFFRWTLELGGLERVAGAEITLQDRMIRLCSPCEDGGGRFVLRDGDALALLNGRATLMVGEARQRMVPSAGGRLPSSRSS